MTAIQAIHIRGHEERVEPKAHVVYRIEIDASVRSWQMWRRYSEFVDLHTELTKSTGAPPPSPLPPKHAFGSIFKARDDPAIMAERCAGLEAYLRAILSSKDDRWRDAFAFRDFLGVPVGKQSALDADARFTSSSWLDEHQDLQARVRDVRAEINRRDALSDRGDISGAHGANVQAKKQLAAALSRIGTLGRGLEALGMGGMSEGELRRRTDMVARLQDDCEKLARMVTVARQTSRAAGSSAATERNAAPETDRGALLGAAGGAWGNKPARRVFGAPASPPKETEETRPLDDTGLLQLQRAKMEQQDEQVSALSAILHRQKQLGLAIGNEIREQIEMLDDLDNEVDRVGGKLTGAKRQMNRLG